jgi:hypothetical protein
MLVHVCIFSTCTSYSLLQSVRLISCVCSVCFVLPFSLGWGLGVGIVRSPDRCGLKVSAGFYRSHWVKRARVVFCSEWLMSLGRVAYVLGRASRTWNPRPISPCWQSICISSYMCIPCSVPCLTRH